MSSDQALLILLGIMSICWGTAIYAWYRNKKKKDADKIRRKNKK